MAGLVVYVEGSPLPEPEARAFWQRFSDWMEQHRGDLAGFAVAEGFASVHPGVEDGRPVLYASRTVAQRPYAAVRAPAGRSGGSGGRQDPGRARAAGNSRGRKSRGKRRR